MAVAELHNRKVAMAKAKSASKSSAKKSSGSRSSSSTRSKGDSRNLYDAAPQTTVHVNDASAFLPEGSANIGEFATVTGGEHQGRYGVVEQVATFDSKGWPKEVIFRTRDADSARLTVKYSDLKASEAGHR